jgi:hypothetical protein
MSLISRRSQLGFLRLLVSAARIAIDRNISMIWFLFCNIQLFGKNGYIYYFVTGNARTVAILGGSLLKWKSLLWALDFRVWHVQ